MRIRLIEGRPQGATSRERRCHAALAAGGVAVRTDLRRAGDFKPASGRLLANALLDLRRPPTALFICNHRMTRRGAGGDPPPRSARAAGRGARGLR